MKRILIGSLAMLGMVAYSFGQGEVFIANSAASNTHIWTNDTPQGWATTPTGTGRIAGGAAGTWVFALFAADNAVDSAIGGLPWLDPAWTFTDNYAANTATAGRIAPTLPNANGSVTIANVPAGTTSALMVIGWNAASGGNTLASFATAWETSAAGLWFGYSDVAHVQLGNGALIPDNFIWGLGAGQITGFTVAPVPEPTTFALAGLGAAALLIFRRRK